jgi:hypothetical protein
MFAVLLVVGAASCAALFSHVGIDLAGDVVLAHDTYDGLDHGSRSEVVALALSLTLGALLRFVWLALQEARTGRAASLPRFEDVFGREPWRFLAAVVALTLPALMTMELFDVIVDGRRIDDVTDLLGGSALLGLGLTIPIAALVALAVRCIARLIMDVRPRLVAVFGRIIALLARISPRVQKRKHERNREHHVRTGSILSRRSGKRGPPLRAS